MMNAASCSQEYESEEDSTEWCDVVTVFWDINGFPVPYGVDAGSICRDIIKGLQAFKHSGPFTIEVFGLLTHVPTDVLRALSSYGIILKNVPFDFTGIINQWISVNTPPANLLVFTPYYSETSYKFLTSSSQQGYNITVTFHYSEWWDLCYGAGETDDTGSETDDTGSETDDTDDSWFCSVSHEMSGKSIDDLITHLSQEHELKPTEIVAGVTVFWDINSYPVPFCCEARHVCLTIKNLLEKYYYGPFTIYAIGLLTRVPADVLRALSSSGIILKNVPFDFTDIINQWISVNPPPAETLVFSPYSKTYDKIVASRKDQGYNIAVSQYNYSVWEFLVLDPVLDREDYLTRWEEAGKSSVTAEHAASWYSSESHDISGKGFENFMTHLSQEHVQEEPTEIVAAVTVFWDINAFPLPLCFEARHVCLHINHYLEGRGYSGNFTINAIGLLTRIPADVLRALSSSGIILKNVAFDFTDIMNQWISVNPPPANTLVLSPYDSETFAKFVAPLKEQGYNIMVPQLNYSDWEQFCLEASETLKEEDKCSETDSSWVCSLCQDISGKSFENFLTHLYQKHFHEELMKKRMKEKREAFEAGGEAPLDSRPDTVWVERLSVLAAPSECHEKTLVSEAGKRSVTGEHGASWYSSESHDISGKGFEISMTHLSQEHVQEEPTEIVAAVKVFWDINAFPVPLCCEARQVCLRIKQHLEGRGYSGNFTINAAGLLTRIPAGTLRALWSNGIILKHVPFDFTDIMNQWISVNPPPANTLVLSPYYSETFANFVAPLKEQGYNIMVPQHNYSDWEQFCLEETLKEEDKCSETDSSWVCSLCQDISGKSFENFLTHLYQEHVHEELMKKRMKEKREAFEAGGEAPLDSRPDTVWVERLSVLAAPSECHEKTLVSEAGKRSVTGEHGASWYSSESHDISGKGFEISMTHLSQEHVQEEPTEIVAAVKVFWDINAFPVPLCCEARQVCLRIKQHLEGRGYSGNFTINAAGLLTRIPAGTLRALWSNGIILKHVPFDFTDIMNQWISVNPPPANTLVLSPYYSETFANFVAPLKEQGYNIMVPQHNYSDWEQFCLEETLKEEDKCSETDSSWVCSLCQDISGKSFENFLTHLYQEHVHEELMKKRMKEKREAFEAGGEAPLDSRPDTVWVERLSVLAAPSECHEKTLVSEAGKRSVTGEHGASWYSSESHDISGKGFEISMTHLSQEHVQEEPTEIVAAVKVFWDINAFPVPLCCEARQVCLRIKQHLEGRGYSGNFTINAAGLLTRIPAGTLRALWSNGIILKHVPFDFTDIMNQWISVNPPPANTLVLSPYYSETFANFVAPLKEQGYNIMVPQHNYSDWEQFCLEASETLKEEDKCSETDSSWVCSLCQDISGKSFENFMTHLYQEHVHEELMKKRMKEKREAFEAGGEAPLDSRPDTVWVERLSVLAAPSECHEKEEAVEALFKKQRKARMPQKMKLKRRIKKAFEAGDEALMNTMSDKGCHEKKQRKAKMKPKMKMKWRIKR